MSLDPILASIVAGLAPAHDRHRLFHPGGPRSRQPLHTVYGGAHLFRHDVAPRLGLRALEALDRYAPDPITFARAIGLSGSERLPRKGKKARALVAAVRADMAEAQRSETAAWLACAVYDRVRAKLEREPVEDYRIDFEDGFGPRGDEEEDAAASNAAQALARGLHDGRLPPFIGIRIKPLDARHKSRAARTLERFIATLAEDPKSHGLPRFVVTLPKVQLAEEVWALSRMLAHLELQHRLPQGWARIEIMVERAPSFFALDGRFNLPGLLDASEGRCVGVHFGSYDMAASAGVVSGHQTMDHPICELALGLYKLAYADRGIFLSDGATNVLPVAHHRGDGLGKKRRRENREGVHRAWAAAYRNIRRSLVRGFYQGWDLHPAQLPVRYAATYAFFLEELTSARARLEGFLQAAAQATLSGTTFDDAATGLGLLNFFARAHGCGALTAAEVESAGITVEQAHAGSFGELVAERAQQTAAGADDA